MIPFQTDNLSNPWDIHLEIRKNIYDISADQNWNSGFSVVLSILKSSCQMLINFCLNVSSNRERITHSVMEHLK